MLLRFLLRVSQHRTDTAYAVYRCELPPAFADLLWSNHEIWGNLHSHWDCQKLFEQAFFQSCDIVILWFCLKNHLFAVHGFSARCEVLYFPLLYCKNEPRAATRLWFVFFCPFILYLYSLQASKFKAWTFYFLVSSELAAIPANPQSKQYHNQPSKPSIWPYGRFVMARDGFACSGTEKPRETILRVLTLNGNHGARPPYGRIYWFLVTNTESTYTSNS